LHRLTELEQEAVGILRAPIPAISRDPDAYQHAVSVVVNGLDGAREREAKVVAAIDNAIELIRQAHAVLAIREAAEALETGRELQ